MGKDNGKNVKNGGDVVMGGTADEGRVKIDNEAQKGHLIFENGKTVAGYSFGARKSMAGEVVFNTGMVGYTESLTDPSYRGQILVLTYPLVGNYGVPGDEKDEHGLPKFYESNEIHIAGLIVSDYSAMHSHWNAVRSLGDWLQQHGIPALQGVDTRMLTKMIREHGSMLGKIQFPEDSIEFMDPNKVNLIQQVSTKEVRVFNKGKSPRILAYDCGMKYNIIREFIKREVELTVVPYDFDVTTHAGKFDGLFISNGPGDPAMASVTIENIKKVLDMSKTENGKTRPLPIFGICLGNQLLALAAGAKTYKMKYGNRGANQPCIDLRTTQCYITPQNHGYAVDDKNLPTGWKTLFMNANDYSNEGIIHESKPYFSAQFHPEANGGPMDTSFLFDMFIHNIVEDRSQHTLVPPQMYHIPTVRKCILVGSGGLSIGQAGEFDYSGSQAIKALKEENIEVILINPNIATVQTSKNFADKVYFLPVTPEMVLSVIKKERPDSILVSMGGQTALNVGVKLYEAGELERHNVKVLGTPIPVIMDTEDREAFAGKLAEINEYCAQSYSATNMEEAKDAAKKIGFPVLVRAAFALGGLGSGFAKDMAEFEPLCKKAFSSSHQIIIDEDLRGWKEVEYEVVRDCKNNCVTVCNMENFDPLGIHTGDSIVIAPSQTLSNSEYFMLRETALKVVRHLGVVGECNIQYALHPESERYCIIEVNARLSRSSALASKATGYPLAYVATKLALGKDLVMVRNSVTTTTTANFEPSLDYIVAKVPRWDLKKFHRVADSLGSSMKSVGEVMAIGRKFEEVIQKAVRMVDPSLYGFDSKALDKKDAKSYTGDADLDSQLQNPTSLRLFAVARALEQGYSVDKLFALTKIDRWFLSKLKNVTDLTNDTRECGSIYNISKPMMKTLKCHGFSDEHISVLVNSDEVSVRRRRIHELGIVPFVKQIDTLAAEFPAQTNYLYMTYNAEESDLKFDDHGVMVLGNGPYCIGSSVEFDWSAVSCVRTLRKNGIPAVVVNYNPETVSTDYDESDRLYFEELSFERTLDIYEIEKSMGVIVSVGGQIPNCLAMPLSKQGVRILGTSPASIDCAEDRNKFSALLDRIGVDQPEWAEARSLEDADKFAREVTYPVLVRPSYVLSGAAMRVAADKEQLRDFLETAADVSVEHPVVVSKYIVDAKEIEFDSVAKDGQILNYAISEHVENAGVHSGDATLVLPAQKLYVETQRRVKRIAGNIAAALKITGPFNIQFIAKGNDVKVIECNLRASRTFPFVSKTFQTNFIELATRAMVGLPVYPANIKLLDLDYVGVKAPMFSFTRLQGADPTLGVEMASTGEVACYGQDMHEAFLLAMMSAGMKIPDKTKGILFAVGPNPAKESLAPYAKILNEKLGYKLYGTEGTVAVFKERGVKIDVIAKPSASKKASKYPNVKEMLSNDKIGMVFNIPDRMNRVDESDGYHIRRTAVDFGISLVTNEKLTIALVSALDSVREIPCLSIQDIYALGEATMSYNKPTQRVFRSPHAQGHAGTPRGEEKKFDFVERNLHVRKASMGMDVLRKRARTGSFTGGDGSERPEMMQIQKLN
uniref:Uncharacterized protein n=1 Tax=Mucochytrium quahogii TaxID=96639 RepID=A0A7S2S5X3_9STRA|mmetsp:Transcript_30070/g.47797  ORF Transcript_30070/g.47797 Transcript_30070/m.47797 type:complete len:1571 (+) Transcript_30070:212-4924(+)|eukprot:CAMPEP_0203745062 /NCGR_PEP_ID=MMETSP0098-20131031/920_1 /ASSEMBLY_ACC=CAM_ASM_000208 /TAXON_ID=96639 /ORGANISM=" , Strain NY0313808BC1" /LENGTH=1570 /DNA_ID=CAMNT_0050632745 /DNA_START=191 /DNA_END=4903 /DNA_ORIENTATION=+